MEILTRLNRRVKHQKSFRLIARKFCMIYIEMAFDRLTIFIFLCSLYATVHVQEKADMASTLIANISKFPSQHQDMLLRIVVKAMHKWIEISNDVIGDYHKCQIDESIGLKYKLGSDDDRGLFVEFCFLTIQMPVRVLGEVEGFHSQASHGHS
ncbi:hypothetical protein EJ110_NYTH15878 [Nymphaea thermarum]|nr:hypothetical protein EJ110_NYTH15878 [Nymphaea thermarum]